MKRMNTKLALLCFTLIVLCSLIYGYVNRVTHTFEVWASDQAEHTVKCYPFRMEVVEWDSLVLTTSDTDKVIAEISRHYLAEEGLAFVLFVDSCVHLEYDSLHATKAIYQLIEGVGCSEFEGENLIEFY